MKNTALALFLTAAACGSDVDLQLGLGPTSEVPAASFEELSWTDTVSGAEFGRIDRLAWVEDGDLVALGRTIDSPPERSFLTRHAGSDGTVLWRVPTVPAHFVDFDIGPDGRLIVAGNFYGVLDLGQGPMQSGPCGSGFLARYQLDGTLVDGLLLPEENPSSVLAMPDGGATYGSSEILCGSAPLDEGLAPPAALARLDSSGQPLWRLELGEEVLPTRLARTGDGDILLQGLFVGTLTVGDLSAESGEIQDFHPYITRVSADSTARWITVLPLPFQALGGDGGYALGVTESPDGNIFTQGGFEGAIELGPFELQADRPSMFVAELDGGGQFVDAQAIEGPGIVNGRAVSLQGEHVAFSGDVHDGTLDLGDGPMRGGFAAIRDGSGAILDSRGLTPPDDTESYSEVDAVRIGPNGDIAVAGNFVGTIDFGAGPVAGNGPSNGFLAVYRPAPAVD